MGKQIVAFKMKLNAGKKEAYKKRHDDIWPELSALLKESGISDAVQTVSGENSSQQIGQNKVLQRWWEYMADIMETNDDFSPVAKPLELVFHMD
jgi:L-rhamnose mutarotase